MGRSTGWNPKGSDHVSEVTESRPSLQEQLGLIGWSTVVHFIIIVTLFPQIIVVAKSGPLFSGDPASAASLPGVIRTSAPTA